MSDNDVIIVRITGILSALYLHNYEYRFLNLKSLGVIIVQSHILEIIGVENIRLNCLSLVEMIQFLYFREPCGSLDSQTHMYTQTVQ